MDQHNNQFVYYDCLISNYNSPNASIPLIFNDNTRSSPLIKDTTGRPYTMTSTLSINKWIKFKSISKFNQTNKKQTGKSYDQICNVFWISHK